MQTEVSENLDIEQRKCNIIIHGLEEDSCEVDLDDLSSQGNKDMERVIDMLGRGLKLKASNHVVSVSRMGKPRDGRPRLLKVQLRSVEGKGEVLKRAKNLKQNEVLESGLVYL